MSQKTVFVRMRTQEQEHNRPNPETLEVLRFAWDPCHQLPRVGEALVVQGLPLIVRHVEWAHSGEPFSGLTPTIEVSRRADHPALRPDEDQDEDQG